MRRNAPERIAEIIEERTRQLPNGCVVWTGYRDLDGYARIGFLGRDYLVHRLTYAMAQGELPDGLEIDHVCHTRDLTCPGGKACGHRPCVNPQHLELVTRRENIRRMALRSPTCARGHVYDEANTYFTPAGRRYCRACNAAAQRRRKAARR